ncbi:MULTISPECIES: bifunctional protein-serine/threonine kinase/phosphatase [unclassified Pseudoalteromonas]|uniref:bifunctional protein-serine/threonine kinase/phosphatase n=1 Tax=unclassified Pseudoalteromonas TaxID=194690 RepID=UPI000CF5E443|nr:MULTISPECIES: bifunctional protein-serine/threonine kinase/phosphatase [unclassified Pseudoalteromonas]MBS3798036.1 bifunctional protein-serine/threonine kinase/phosphatase [Pseudoalteromonas sp. BDTF-M6]
MSLTQLQVTISQHTEQGVKALNEDAIAAYVPDGHTLTHKGVIACVADGVSSAEAGKEASHYACKHFIEEYSQTPETWSVAHSVQKVLTTINLQLFKKSHAYHTELKGFLTTFSGIVIKSHTLHLFHVGDSRVYLLRDKHLQQLSRDHIAQTGDKATLARAVGMDNNLHIDFTTHTLKQGDILLLTSDGVHDFVPEPMLIHELSKVTFDDAAQRLVTLAKEHNSDDNLSAVAVRIDLLPDKSLNDYNQELTQLPFPPELEVGMKLDGYRIDKELFASSRSQIYLVSDEQSQRRYVMKTPSVNYCDDSNYIERFIQEEWIGKRIDSPHVVKVICQPRPRTCLYYLMEYIDGCSLDQWLAQTKPTPKQIMAVISQIAEGLKAFHGKETIHQDLKPGNIMVSHDGSAKIVDFGSVFIAGIAEIATPLQHHGVLGTASYSDPQYLFGKNSTIQGDIYALATIVYEAFTGKLPYGSRIEQCNSRFEFDRLHYIPANRYNPVIPFWFDKALEKGVKINLEERYQRLDDLMADLLEPNPAFFDEHPKINESQSKLRFWQLVSGFWLLVSLILVALFSLA